MFYLLSSLWFIRQTKALLFWLYLWQLKEYHLGRLLDHFRTDKGKKLLLNPFVILKIVLLLYAFFLSLPTKLLPWQLYASWLSALIILYLFESVKFFQDLFQKTFKKPVLTKKTLILISAVLIFEILFLFVLFQKIELFYWFAFLLLSFDILTPFIASIIVFLVQPFAVIFFRNKIIKKAKRKRAEFKNLLVVGICGSYGKTSTKEFLAEILSEKFHPVKCPEGQFAKGELFNRVKVLKTKEHQNSEVGISLCILNDLKPEHEIFVVEMGAYNKGGIKLLCDIVKPKIGIITGINEQHLSTFGSTENLISAEGGKELIESLPEDGLVIFNGNNKYCQKIYQETKISKKICYSVFSTTVENVLSGDFWAVNIKVGKESLSFKLFSKGGDSANFKVNLIGAQNVENILLAACCAKEFGMTLRKISTACKKINPLPYQMELKKGVGGVNIIDATYSANPEGVISHLEYLKIWEGKKIIIMPCLIELGKSSAEAHKKIGQKIGEVCDSAIITTKERFKEIRENAGDKSLFLENPKEIFDKISFYLKPESVILLEGRVPQKLINVLLEKQKNV